MILSHRWRFIFIKGHKVAGTSVEMALSTICGPDDVVTPITPRDEVARFRAGGECRNFAWNPSHEATYREAIARFVAGGDTHYDALRPVPLQLARYYNHMGLTEVLSRHGGDLGGYHVFCVERSPYSKAMSWANMHVSYDEYAAGGEFRADANQVAAALDQVIADGSLRAARNIERYRGPDGALAARVLRYAQLQDELYGVLREIGAPIPALPHAKKGLMSDTLDPRVVLRADQIEHLNQLFRDEFEAFGYPMIAA